MTDVPTPATAMKRFALAACLCCALMTARVMADEVNPPEQTIDIPADDLAAALEVLARQTGIEFVYDAEELKGIKSHGVRGSMTAKEAVLQLLAGTNLTLTEHDSGAMLIAAPANAGTVGPSSTTSSKGDGKAVQSKSEANVSNDAPPAVDQKARRNSALAEIVVTGTHIAGITPVGSDLTVYTRADIEQSGSATLDQFARQMPENFSAADTIATVNTNANIGIFRQGAANNVFGGAGFNLNGLGPGATLTLLNGHRLAPGAFDGSLVDISQIPLSAVDHIEVLDDGASAIYGSDAVAGVVNIITRRDFDGAQSSFRYGGSSAGGAAEYSGSQLLGHSWNTGNILLDYDYDDQSGLDASQRNWIGAQSSPVSLIPENRRNSAFVTGSQDIGSEVTLSADALYSVRDFESDGILNVADAPVRQFSSGHVTESAASINLGRKFYGNWYATLTGSFSNIQQLDNIDTASASGSTFNEDMQQLVANSGIYGIDALASGSLFRFYGGDAKASLGAGLRSEQFRSYEFDENLLAPISLQRQVASAYGELLLPYIDAVNAQPWARRLEVSAAYRYDHYSEFGSTSNPKIGWLWEPVTGFRLKGTYGRSFQAPLLSQFGSPITSETLLIPDSLASSGHADVLEVSGGNPNLLPQSSKSITAGFDYEPASVSGLALSMSYFYVSFKNRIQAPSSTSQAFLSQASLIPFLSGNPSAAAVQPYFSSPGFQGDFARLGPAGVVAIFDDQLANMASTIESDLRLSAQYSWPTAYGQFKLWLSGTHFLSDRIQTATLAPWFDIDNTIGEPTSWRVRGSLGWVRNEFTSGITINYVNAYQNTLFTPSQTIASWTTANFYLTYDAGAAPAYPVRNLRISLSVQNLADQRPPYLRIPAQDLLPRQNAIPFDGTNASPVGRFVAVQITKDW